MFKKKTLGFLVIAMMVLTLALTLGACEEEQEQEPEPEPEPAITGPLTEVKWLEILQGIEADIAFDGILDLSGYTRSDSAAGNGLRSDGTFDPGSNIPIGKGKITSIILPGTATAIAGGTSDSPTFRYFTNLETFSGALLTSIGNYAFAGCAKLSMNTLPAWLTSIGEGAFQNCTSLTFITLPAEITSIGAFAFRGCSSLTRVSSPRAAPPTLGTGTFSNTHSNLVIRVPNASITDYQEAIGWRSYSDVIIAIGSTPVITIGTQPSATRNFAQGSINGSLSVSATVMPDWLTLSYQWYSNTSNSSTGGTAINGATSASYTVPAGLTTGTYYYFCEVRATGAMSVRSNVAVVNVAVPGITITTQPAATTNVAYGNISGNLSVAASIFPTGPSLSYQWYSNTSNSNTGGTAISGATSVSYTIPTNLTEGMYYYFCEVRAVEAASVRSNVARVNVTIPVITINTQPVSTTNVAQGSISGSLSVTASVSPTGPSISYQWYSNTSNSSTGGTAISGATSARYTIPTNLTAGTYYYFCEVSVAGVTPVRSNVATVNVYAITINTQPAATTNVLQGSINGSLSLLASVSPTELLLSYQWYSNTSNSSTGGTAISGATSASYTIPTNLTEGMYYYFCEVSAVGAASVRSNVARVTVISSIDIDMVWINAGTFTRSGSLVTLTSGFYMGVYEVTWGQYRAVMSDPNESRFPVTGVSWYDAIVFCNRLSIMEGFSPAYRINGSTNPDDWGTVPTSRNATWNAVEIVSGSTGYRLPTEAQWEYACRAGTTTLYNTGNSITNSQANFGSNQTTAVGSYAPNAWGLYDMHGNISEWCWDWYGTYPSEAQTDPTGAASGGYRVVRGGSWLHDASSLRSAYRNSYNDPSGRSGLIGFRLVRP